MPHGSLGTSATSPIGGDMSALGPLADMLRTGPDSRETGGARATSFDTRARRRGRHGRSGTRDRGEARDRSAPGCQLHKLGPAVRRCEPALDQIGKGWARTHRRRYSLGHGVPPCWRRRQPAPIAEILSQDAPLPIFPATLGLHRAFSRAFPASTEIEGISFGNTYYFYRNLKGYWPSAFIASHDTSGLSSAKVPIGFLFHAQT